MPLLSRTVPVIVAKPRVPLPCTVAVIPTSTASATSGAVNLKIFLIAAGPPGKPPADLRGSVLERKRTANLKFVRFSGLYIRCLSGYLGSSRPDSSFRPGEGDFHPFEFLNS